MRRSGANFKRPLRDRALAGACQGLAWTIVRPMRMPAYANPGMAGLKYQRVRLTHNGQRLAAWYVPCEGSKAGVVLCHGHAAGRTQFFTMLRPLHEAGFHLLLFDHRSQGHSSGGLCSYGYHEQEDLLAAGEWLRSEAGVEHLGFYGISMGGATSLLAAARDPGVEAVVTDSAFARLDEIVERRFLWLPPSMRGTVSQQVAARAQQMVGADLRELAPEDAVRAWKPRPLLVIHGGGDILIPPAHAERLAEAAGPQGELWIIPGAHHTWAKAIARKEYPRRVAAFFREHLLEKA